MVNYMQMLDGYRVLITYITSAGNNRGQRILHVNEARIKELTEHPEKYQDELSSISEDDLQDMV